MAMVLQFECRSDQVAEAIDAVRKFMIGAPRLFESKPLPASPLQAQEFESLAQMIARALRPRPDQTIRREALKFMLDGNDTFYGQRGEKDPALRNATGAISKALRRFDRFAESPLDLIVTRTREVFQSGPDKGVYRGTRYAPTRLGQRVREILKAWDEI